MDLAHFAIQKSSRKICGNTHNYTHIYIRICCTKKNSFNNALAKGICILFIQSLDLLGYRASHHPRAFYGLTKQYPTMCPSQVDYKELWDALVDRVQKPTKIYKDNQGPTLNQFEPVILCQIQKGTSCKVGCLLHFSCLCLVNFLGLIGTNHIIAPKIVQSWWTFSILKCSISVLCFGTVKQLKTKQPRRDSPKMCPCHQSFRHSHQRNEQTYLN